MKDDEIKRLLFKVLYQVLIEIREEAYLIDNKKIHKLSDLTHNLPLGLLNEENESEELMKKLKLQAKSLGLEKWLEGSLRQL